MDKLGSVISMESFVSKYVEIVKDSGWTRDDKVSRPDRGYAKFYRTMTCAIAPNPGIHNLIEREILKIKYPGNRDFKVEFDGLFIKLSSVFDSSDD